MTQNVTAILHYAIAEERLNQAVTLMRRVLEMTMVDQRELLSIIHATEKIADDMHQRVVNR